MLTFRFDEVMMGSHRLRRGGADAAMEFRVTWGGHLASLFGILTGSAVLPLHGRMWMDGVSWREKCRGSLELAYREGRITYRIFFEGSLPDLGRRRLVFTGSKTGIRPWNLHRTHTTCLGHVALEDGTVVSDCLLRFRLRTLPAFLASFRLGGDR